ncbi:MAG: hypothetical protein AUG51_11320 [Acidobacteria bacterium 13_1_20CM_3_53_8]|nr:MAG: hypothetical protein AUG51_11320 [Acidobacteria bacterium 13_1_20CM_3_53_8]
MQLINAISMFISYGVIIAIVATVLLMILRLLFQYADVNPFSRPALMLRRITDPMVTPLRRALVRLGIEPNFAPLILILIVILLGWFVIQLSDNILGTILSVIDSARQGAFVKVLGYILLGALNIYMLLIFIRIIFSWGMVSYTNRIMRFLVNVTEPLLAPLRRMIPPLGTFDLSPIVAFILILLLKAAVQGTLLR